MLYAILKVPTMSRRFEAHISIRLPRKLLEKLEKIAMKREMSITALIRELLKNFVKKEELLSYSTITILPDIYDTLTRFFLICYELKPEETEKYINNIANALEQHLLWKHGKPVSNIDRSLIFNDIRELLINYLGVSSFEIKNLENHIYIMKWETLSEPVCKFISEILTTFFEKFMKAKVKDRRIIGRYGILIISFPSNHVLSKRNSLK